MTDVAGIHYGQYRRDRYRRRDLPALWYDFLNYHRLTDALRTGGPNVLSARTSGAMQRDSSGALVWAPHQLLENANLSEPTEGLPSGWIARHDWSTENNTLMEADGYFKVTQVAANNRPTMSNSGLDLIAGAIYTIGFYIHDLDFQSGSNTVMRSGGTSGTDGSMSQALYDGPGWYATVFKMGPADTAAGLYWGIGNQGNATGTHVWSRPFLVRGQIEGIAPGQAAKLSGPPWGQWIGTDDGDAPLYRARFDHDKDGNALGLGPGEGARTNLLPYSNDFSQWDALGGVAVDTGATTGPDGSPADRISQVTDANDRVEQDLELTLDTVHSNSIYLKNDDATQSRLRIWASGIGEIAALIINWAGSVPSTSSSSGLTNIAYRAEVNNWYRVEFTFTSNDTEATHAFRIYPQHSAAALGIYAILAMSEEAAFPSPTPIPTSGASATRDDEEYYTDSVPAAITAASAITVYVKGSVAVGTTAASKILLDLSSENDIDRVSLQLTGNNRPRVRMRDGGSTIADISLTSAVTQDAAFEVCLRVAPDDIYLVASTGESSTDTDTSGALPLGQFADIHFLMPFELSQPFWGHIQEVKIWTRAFTDAECDAQVGI